MRALGAAAAVAVVAGAIHASRTLLAAYRERLRLEIESALQAQPPSEAAPHLPVWNFEIRTLRGHPKVSQ